MRESRIALTFDAEHPSRHGALVDGAERILDCLRAARTRATFFIQGRWATAYPEVARRIASDGHLVGNHSNYHAPMTLLSADGIRIDVTDAERRIRDVVGVDPRPWFRCPFGDGSDDPAVLDALGALGYRAVGWDVDSTDWQPGRNADHVAPAVLNALAARRDPAVILFHTWPAATSAALPAILDQLRRDGAPLVTMEELSDGS